MEPPVEPRIVESLDSPMNLQHVHPLAGALVIELAIC